MTTSPETDIAAASGPSPHKERRSQESRRTESERRLLDAAREIVARKGWAGLTLAEVGVAAGYSRGIANQRFGTKAALLQALARHINSAFMAEIMKAPPREPGLDSVLGFVTVYLSRPDKSWTNTRALIRLLADGGVEGSETDGSLVDYNREVRAYLEEQIRAGIAAGNIRADVSPVAGAFVILGALRGVMLQKLLESGDIELVEVRDQLLTMLQRSLGAS
jgi:AcrR family transcriptional regulator